MAIAVFGQLGHILRERNLTVSDLKRQIEDRYGLDADSLDGLIGPQSVRQADMTVAAAASIVLGVDLGDLFAVEDVDDTIDPSLEEQLLDEEPGRRMWTLLDLQEERDLSDRERLELNALIEKQLAITDACLGRLGRDPQRLIAYVKLAKRRKMSAAS